MNVYDSVYALASPALVDYRRDLEVHDREAIEANPRVPFLHWTRENGTQITFMPDGDSYPAPGVYVPYLFGAADRWHILKEKACYAKHFLDPMYAHEPARVVLHFDGMKLRKITAEKALEIVKAYQRRIESEWRGDRGKGSDKLEPAHCYC